MIEDIYIGQNHLHFLATEISKSANNFNTQFMWNYFSFMPILYKLRKGNAMYILPVQST